MIKLYDKEIIEFLGEQLVVEFAQQKFVNPKVVRTGDVLKVYEGQLKSNKFKEILHKYLFEQSRKFINSRVESYSKQHDFQYKRVAIKDTSSRWGSCSSEKNLNFNWRLSFAPLKVLDYVVVHELCHTVEMNHSSRFWDLVAKVMPEYKLTEIWLKRNGRELSVG